MELKKFVGLFAEQFEETDIALFTKSTIFKDLDEWDSLSALSVMAMVDEEMEKRITGADLLSCNTIEELFNLAQSK